MLPDFFPQELRVPYYVTGFRGAIATKRPLFESLFNLIATTRAKMEPLEAEVAAYADDIDGLRALLDDPERKAKVWEAGTHRALYTDSASALLLLIDAEYDRFFYSTGISLYDRGTTTYVDDVRLTTVIHTLAIHYKHLAEWRVNKKRGEAERAILAKMIDDPMRADAAAEFLQRAFADYDAFAAAVLTCVDDIVTDGVIPENGSAGIPTITARPADI